MQTGAVAAMSLVLPLTCWTRDGVIQISCRKITCIAEGRISPRLHLASFKGNGLFIHHLRSQNTANGGRCINHRPPAQEQRVFLDVPPLTMQLMFAVPSWD